jgi:hypothetical protein
MKLRKKSVQLCTYAECTYAEIINTTFVRRNTGTKGVKYGLVFVISSPCPSSPPPNHSIIRQKLSFEGIQHSNVILIGAPASPWAPFLSSLPPYPFLSCRVFYLPLPLLQPYPFLPCTFLPSSALPPTLPYPFLPCRAFYLPLPLLHYPTLFYHAELSSFLCPSSYLTQPFFTMQSFLPSSALPPTLPNPFLPCRAFFLPLPFLLPYTTLFYHAELSSFLCLSFHLNLLFKVCRDFFLPLPFLLPYPTLLLSCRVFFLPLPFLLPTLPFFIMQSFLSSSGLPPTLAYSFLPCRAFFLPLPFLLPYPTLFYLAELSSSLCLSSHLILLF